MNQTIGRYEILGRLAMGGMAEILLARLRGPSGFERPVVVKRILPHLAEQRSFVDMFLDEARLASQIHHRNVVQVHELGQQGRDLYLVMEYLEGENVAGLIRRTIVAGRELDPVLSAYIIAEAAAGLHAAHELTDASGKSQELVHRDVSPQNIFVTYAGGIRVLDFGVAKAADRSQQTEAGQLKGKFEYMSPEQCRGRPVDRRSDVFALGIVLYEMVTRKRLFKRDNRLATLEAIWRDATPPPSSYAACPAELERIILKALEKNPEDRYQSAADFRRDLMTAVQSLHPGVLPEEALSTLLRELFTDRIDAKREMLQSARAGESPNEIPSADVDSQVEIPEVEQRDDVTGYTAGADAYGVEQRKQKRRVWQWTTAAGAVLLLAVGATVWVTRDRPAEQRLRAVARTIALPQVVFVPTAPAVPTTVAVSITSKPLGASVIIAGKDEGVTPLDVSLPRGEGPLELELRKKGYRVATERLTPDVNQRLRVVLVPEPSGGRPAAGAGFRRFD